MNPSDYEKLAAKMAPGLPAFNSFDDDIESEVEPNAVLLTCGSDLRPEPIDWLWRQWLALGKLSLVAGAPGTGKTTIVLSFAACVTAGTCWPDGTPCDKTGDVLIWSGEDDPADTLMPRLLAAGADPSRVHFVTGTRYRGEVQPFDPARDLLALQDAAEKIGNVRLIMVDPIVSAVTGDSHKNTEVRRALQPLVDLAARLNAALVGITHFSKGGQGQDPSQRVMGSVAFTAVARVVLVAAKVKSDDGTDKRILARSKSNIGPDDGGFEYTLEQSEPLPGIQASYVQWGTAVQGTARELLTDPADDTGDTKNRESAEDFLREVLADGPTPTKTVEAETKSAGYSWATIRRASDALGVKKRKGASSTGEGAAWYWSLPNLLKTGQLAQLAQLSKLSNLSNLNEIEQVGGEKSTDRECI